MTPSTTLGLISTNKLSYCFIRKDGEKIFTSIFETIIQFNFSKIQLSYFPNASVRGAGSPPRRATGCYSQDVTSLSAIEKAEATKATICINIALSTALGLASNNKLSI